MIDACARRQLQHATLVVVLGGVFACAGHPRRSVRPAPAAKPPVAAPVPVQFPAGVPVESRVAYVLDPAYRPGDWQLSGWGAAAGATVFINGDYERWLYTRSDDALTSSSVLLPEPIIAVGHAFGALRMLAESGTIYSSMTLLGSVSRLPGVGSRVRAGAVGRAAIVAVTTDGTMVRTTDLEHWVAPERPPAASIERVVLSPTGTGLAISNTELFSTTDDGATWKAEPGASFVDANVENEADGTPLVVWDRTETFERFIGTPPKLAGPFSFVAPRNGRMDPLAQRHLHYTSCGGAAAHHRALGDDTVFEVNRPTLHAAFVASTHRLGAPSARWSAWTITENCEHDVIVAAWQKSFAAACWWPRMDGSHELPYAWSEDGGVSWARESLRMEKDAAIGQVVVGPRGFLLVLPTCFPGDKCDPAYLRAGKGQAFTRTKWSTREVAATFSEAASRAYLLAFDGQQVRLLVSALGETKFVARGKPLVSTDSVRSLSMTTTSNGNLVAAVCQWAECVVLRSADDGVHWTKDLAPGRGSIGVFGERALSSAGWESNDAGKTWSRVPIPHDFEELACTAVGCVGRRGERLGWQL